ncbi:hypothetical protein C4D60_Mb06t23270 [Musa balbisiana]|uniref:Uncharacterized protein n=1 Tax=Musa balbisiana TaxID=52838 RepID=A0A4S8IQ30_MUSBA|nr:hypothetical protein C4D60_Mb06t23270 [Musa balbisiana]
MATGSLCNSNLPFFLYGAEASQQNLAPLGEHFIHADPSCSRNHEPENEAANNQGSVVTSFSSEASLLLPTSDYRRRCFPPPPPSLSLRRARKGRCRCSRPANHPFATPSLDDPLLLLALGDTAPSCTTIVASQPQQTRALFPIAPPLLPLLSASDHHRRCCFPTNTTPPPPHPFSIGIHNSHRLPPQQEKKKSGEAGQPQPPQSPQSSVPLLP